MKILIIAEHFFGYEERIKNRLQQRNYEVDLKYLFVPSSSDRIKKKIFGKDYPLDAYYEKLLDHRKNYDFLLVINGKNMPVRFVEKLSSTLMNASKVLYIWDDMENLDQTEAFYQIFDRKYTYSKFDADKSSGISFLPFFFSHDTENYDREIDVSFVGSLHSDRYKTITQFKRNNPSLNCSFYLYTDVMSYLKYCTGTPVNEVKFKKLDYEKYISLLSKSKAVLELPHPTQKNITTRAIEALGTRTKLITTSVAVKEYDFYNPNNIFILNEENGSELKEWINVGYEENDAKVREKYTMDSWLDHILFDSIDQKLSVNL